MNRSLALLITSALLTVVATEATAVRAKNLSGRAPVNVDVSRRGPVAGLGIEGQDIVSMSDQMLRDMLSTPVLAGRATAPQVIVDSKYFINDSTQRISKDLITDRLRVALNRAAAGRMTFVGRQYAAMVSEEHDLKNNGVVDLGTTGAEPVAQAGGDLRLAGRISSLDSRDASTGLTQRYMQIVFEMVDLDRGVIVWSGIYEFTRAAADDVVYR
jgi:hypothetical protein